MLEIRAEPEGPIVYQRRVTEAGDAILFKLDAALKHRVTEPEGRVPRTVFAGWFRTEPARQAFGLESP